MSVPDPTGGDMECCDSTQQLPLDLSVSNNPDLVERPVFSVWRDQAASASGWTGYSPCAGTNGHMELEVFPPEYCRSCRPAAIGKPNPKEQRDPLVLEYLRPAPLELMMVDEPEEPVIPVQEQRESVSGDPRFYVHELERLVSIRCMMAAAEAAVGVTGLLDMNPEGDPVVAAMHVLARVFNSYRDESVKTIHELKKEPSTLAEGLRREHQVMQMFAFHHFSLHYPYGILDGATSQTLECTPYLVEEYHNIIRETFQDLSDHGNTSDEDTTAPLAIALWEDLRIE